MPSSSHRKVFHLSRMWLIGAFAFCLGFQQKCLAQPSAPPQEPLGLMGLSDPFGRAFTIFWEPVKKATDKTSLKTSPGYNVYRRSSLRDTPVKINAYLLPIPVFADRTDRQVFFYSVRAVDEFGTESADSLIIDSSPQMNLIFLADDGKTSLTIPQNSTAFLRASMNPFGVSLTIKLAEENVSASLGIVRSIQFQLVRGDTGEVVHDGLPPATEASVEVGYNSIGGQVALGAPTALGVEPQKIAGVGAEELALYWNNGVRWLKLGGFNDTARQIIHASPSQIGNYQIRVAETSSSWELTKANVYPPLFTPNNDGFNDEVNFLVNNPKGTPLSGEILDLSGRTVADMHVPATSNNGVTMMSWNGTLSAGNKAASGLYLYRIKGDGRTTMGSIALAR